MQENNTKGIEEIISDAKIYLENRIEYTRLYVVGKVATLVADVITNVVVIICFVLAFLFGSVTLAMFLSSVFDSFTAGFGSVALIYLLIAIGITVGKKSFEKAIANMAVRKYFNKLADKEEDEKV
jgi:uncharacterized membrane protein